MKTRTDLLNHLATKHKLQRYLEIGVQVPELNFDKIICKDKIGVDPDARANATFRLTSNEFFDFWSKGGVMPYSNLQSMYITDGTNLFEVLRPEEAPPFEQIVLGEPFDLIFIDGLHTAEQVKKDFENALKILSPNGFIVLHDCNPLKEEHTIVPRPTPTGHWNGDVYKFAFAFYESPHVYTVDIDNGCMVIQKKDGLRWKGVEYLNWDFFDENRKELINLITWDEFVKL